MQGLYILKCHDFYKIGITNNLKNRVMTLQTGNPYKIEVVKFFSDIPSKYLESFLHEALDKYRISGEWFTFGEEGINTLINFIEQYEENLKPKDIEVGVVNKKYPFLGNLDDFINSLPRKVTHVD